MAESHLSDAGQASVLETGMEYEEVRIGGRGFLVQACDLETLRASASVQALRRRAAEFLKPALVAASE